jgi:hypothetical protein
MPSDLNINFDNEQFKKQPQSMPIKADLQDLVDYRYLILNRYPCYSFPDPCIPGYSALAPRPSIDKYCKSLYQLATPDSTWSVHAQLEASRYAVFDPPAPLLDTEVGIQYPLSLIEASDAFLKYQTPSTSCLQLAMEKRLKDLDENLVNLLGNEFSIKEQNYDSKNETSGNLVEMSPQLRRTRKLYQELYPRLSNHITMLVRLLFYLNVSSASSFDNSSVIETLSLDWGSLSAVEKNVEIGKRDGLRHKEIITLAISQIIVFISKAAKRFHILAFEHLSFLLVDNSAPIVSL